MPEPLVRRHGAAVARMQLEVEMGADTVGIARVADVADELSSPDLPVVLSPSA